MIKAIPLKRKEAELFIEKYHRHHGKTQGDMFRVGAEENGELVGVVQCGRPVSRFLDDGKTIEVTRLCTNGKKNVCSFLYARAARVAQQLGYEKIITYILVSELGTSLKASGWRCDETNVGGIGHWNKGARPLTEDTQLSMFGRPKKYPTEKKQRWVKDLKQ